ISPFKRAGGLLEANKFFQFCVNNGNIISFLFGGGRGLLPGVWVDLCGVMMLPTFLGLGSARCATTWLHQVLRLHPQILMTDPKEISYFGKEAACHDLAWYEASFSHDLQKQDAPFRGDISPWYSRATRQTVAAAHALIPDAKLILIIRNPVDRA